MVYLAFVMTSGLARLSDMHRLSRQVRFVPKGDMPVDLR